MQKPPRAAPKKPKTIKIPRSSSRAGFFLVKLITAALLLGAVGVWGYLQVVKMALGRFSFNIIRGSVAGDTYEPRVLLLSPLRTERFLKPDSTDTVKWPWVHRVDDWLGADTLWYAGEMKRMSEKELVWQDLTQTSQHEAHMSDLWEDLLYQNRIIYKVITEPELTRVDDNYNILVLPGALLLSDREKEGIKKFLSDGGNLLACWSPGCRDENGDWSGYQFIEQLFGGLIADPVFDPSGGTSVVLKSDSPLTAMIPPGTHLDLFTYSGFMTMNTVESRVTTDGYWFKPYWKDERQSPANSGSMILRGMYLRGRFVWFSFTADPVQPQKDNNVIIRSLILNAIHWLHGEAIVRAKIWPEGYRAGGALMLDVQSNEMEALEFITLAKQANIPLDLIIDENFAPKRVLAERNFSGGVFLKFSEPQNLFRETLRDEVRLLTQEAVIIQDLTGFTPQGLFPANWEFNETTLQAAAETGFKYYLGEDVPRCYGPSLKEIKPGKWFSFSHRVPMGIMPKSQLSLAEWVDIGFKGEEELADVMGSDVARIGRVGGLYLGIFDNYNLIRQKSGNLPKRLYEEMNHSGFWVAPAHTLMERFCGWRGLRVASEDVTPTRITIRFSNEGMLTAQDITFEVYLTGNIESVSLTSQFVGSRPVNIGWDKKRGVAKFTIPEIGPGDNGAVSIDKVFSASLEL